MVTVVGEGIWSQHEAGLTSFLLCAFCVQFTQGTPFLKYLQTNTKRYQSFFASQADLILDPTKPNCIIPQRLVPQDTFDVLMNQVSSCRM